MTATTASIAARDIDALIRQGQALCAQNRPNQALALLYRAPALEPERVRGYFALGQALMAHAAMAAALGARTAALPA
jgi:hypothetical protein